MPLVPIVKRNQCNCYSLYSTVPNADFFLFTALRVKRVQSPADDTNDVSQSFTGHYDTLQLSTDRLNYTCDVLYQARWRTDADARPVYRRPPDVTVVNNNSLTMQDGDCDLL